MNFLCTDVAEVFSFFFFLIKKTHIGAIHCALIFDMLGHSSILNTLLHAQIMYLHAEA